MSPHIPAPPTQSFWDASTALREILTRKLSPGDFALAEPQFREMGELAVRVVAPLAAIADRESPRLVSNRVEDHSAYREVVGVADGSGQGARQDVADGR